MNQSTIWDKVHHEFIYAYNCQASKVSETLSGVYKFKPVRCMYVWRCVCHNSSTCHAYIMWAELGHSHFYTCQPFLYVPAIFIRASHFYTCQPFLYVPAISNAVTTGNGTDTNNVFKWNRTLRFVYSKQCSDYSAITIAKVSLFSTWTRTTVSSHYVSSVEIDP